MTEKNPDREKPAQISRAPNPITPLRFSARVESVPAFDEKMDAFDKPYWNECMVFAWVRWRDRQKVNAQSPPDSLAYDGAVLYPGTAPVVNGREAESVNIALQCGALRAFKGTNELSRLTWASREARRGDGLIFLRDEVLNCWSDSPAEVAAPAIPATAPPPNHVAAEQEQPSIAETPPAPVAPPELTPREKRKKAKQAMYAAWNLLADKHSKTPEGTLRTRKRIAELIAGDPDAIDPATKEPPDSESVLRRLRDCHPGWYERQKKVRQKKSAENSAGD